MEKFNPLETLDSLMSADQELKQIRSNGTSLEESREDVLNFKFRPGQTVKDLVTGKSVTIIDSQRADYVVKKE